MLDTIRLMGYMSPSQLNKEYFHKTVTGPACISFEGLEDYVCKYSLQDRGTGTFRIGHDGRKPVHTFRRVKTERGVKKVPVIEGGQTYIEFSIGKLLWLTNVHEIGYPGLSLLESFLSEVVGEVFYGVELLDFHITRLDGAFCFVASCLTSLARMDFDRRQGTNYSSSHDKKTQTVLWETRSQKSRFMFYDKVVEVKKELQGLKKREGNKIVNRAIGVLSEVLEGLSGLVRCERKIAHSDDLKRYEIKTLSDVTVSVVREMLMDSLNRLEVPMAEYSEPNEILEVLGDKLSLEEIARWYFIFELRRKVSESDRDFIEQCSEKLGFSYATYHKYKKLFRDAGINVKNLGEMRLKGIKGELEARCKVWEKAAVSLNGKPVENIRQVKPKELLELCRVCNGR